MLGVCYYPEHWDESRWRTDARRMRELGISFVRIGEFAWSRLEPSRGTFTFEWLDRAIDVLHQVPVDQGRLVANAAFGRLDDRKDPGECCECRMGAAVDSSVGQCGRVTVREFGPAGRLQAQAPYARGADREMGGHARRPARDEGPLLDHFARSDARDRRRPLGEAHRSPFGVQVILDQAVPGFDRRQVQGGEIGL